MPRSLPHLDELGHPYGYDQELDFDLLVSQRNELFAIVRQEGFPPGEFDWYATGGGFFGSDGTAVPMLAHKTSGFFCRFGFLDEDIYREVGYQSGHAFDGEFFLQRSPAETKARDVLLWRSWDDVKAGFAEWLGYVRRESTQPDCWVVAPPRELLPAAAPDAPNELFNPEEQQRVSSALHEVKQELSRVADLTVSQREAFDGFVAAVEDSTKRLGRRDWLNALLGGYVSWAVVNLMNSQVAQSIFDLLASKLAWLWNELPKLIR